MDNMLIDDADLISKATSLKTMNIKKCVSFVKAYTLQPMYPSGKMKGLQMFKGFDIASFIFTPITSNPFLFNVLFMVF